MLEYMLMPLKRYAEFGGRSRRKEFWLFWLFVMVIGQALSISATSSGMAALGIVSLIFSLGTLIPMIAVGIRRMHDQDRSGWWILVPIVNLVFFCLEGTKGPNRFGPDPKGEEAAPETFS